MTLAQALEATSTAIASLADWCLSPRFISGLAIAIPLLIIASRRIRHGSSITFNLPFSPGSATINASQADRVAAWKLYVQLKTRKAAIPFDSESDVVVEVHDSLLALFEVTRTLLLELPPDEYSKDNGLASLMLRVQSDGVRLHLTRWQADFRRWWTAVSVAPENTLRSPQQVQRDYPRYNELLADLQRTNTELSKFADELLVVARGAKLRKPQKSRFKPTQPTPADSIEPEKEAPPPIPAAVAVAPTGPDLPTGDPRLP